MMSSVQKTNKGDQNLSKATFKYSPAEASGIFHGSSLMIPFSLAKSAPSILPSNFLKRNFLFGKTSSKSVNPTQPENSGSDSNAGLGAILNLDRSTNINKKLFIRPLVTTYLPIISHRAPPVRVFEPKPNHLVIRVQPGGLYSKLETFLLSFCTRVSNVVVKPNPENVVVTRMLSDQVLTKNCPGKKAKRPNDHCGPRRSSLMMIGDDDLNLGPIHPTSSFLINCYNCKRKLKYTKDIYIYKGEMSFCTIPCREREMFYDEMRERRAKASCSTSRMITGNQNLRNLRGRRL